MDIRLLHYLVTIIEQTSYTKAATKLHISQPSLSMAIKKLENQLGLTLIDRGTRELRVTTEGKILYQEAKKLLNHVQHVTDEMRRLRLQGPLKLSIGLIESTMFWIPTILTKFKEDYEDVHVKVLEVLSLSDVVNALNNFDIHLAITNQYIEHEAIETLPIYEENLIALLPPRHPLRTKQFLNINELQGEDFIVCQEGFQTREDILNAMRKSGVKAKIQFEIERFETACRLVEEGLGITVIPENYVNNSSGSKFHIKEIRDSNISRTVYLAYGKNRYLPPLVERFINLVRDFFSEKVS